MPNFRVSFKGSSVDLKGARRKNSLSGIIHPALVGSLRVGYARLCDTILFMLIGSLYLVRCPFGADWFRR
jgi:hypothetical protein